MSRFVRPAGRGRRRPAGGARGRRLLAAAALLLAMTGTAALARAEISQRGTLQVTVNGELAPKRLPRTGVAPISVTVGAVISTIDDSLAPQLKRIRIELNRYGRLEYEGLPTCRYNRIQPGSSSHALNACRSALVGKGTFDAAITLAGQEPYPTKGKLLVFNGVRHGKPVLYGHIYAPHPFATSFVLVFKLSEERRGVYGTVLNASLPKAMNGWGRLTGLKMTLARQYRHAGARHSYVSAGCPAAHGFGAAVFTLARTSFVFTGGRNLSVTLSETCRVRADPERPRRS